MTNKKTSLRALLLSLISVLACVAMLVGSTFAWFTDSVSSMNNIIKSGNLDVVLEYSTDGATWVEVDETTKIFDDAALYEPGYTEVVFLRVSNAGSLALKYQLGVNIVDESSSTNVYDEEFFLSDYLQVGFYNQAEYNGANNWGALLPFMFADRQAARNMVSGNSHKLSEFGGMALNDRPVLPGDTSAELIALVLYMPEEVGNEANHKTGVDAPEINLGVNLLATQYTYEEDSFDEMYDAGATYPVVNASELVDVLNAGANAVLAADIDLTNTTIKIPASTESSIDLAGNTLSGVSDVASTAKLIEVPANSALTISNGTVEFAGVPDTNWGGAGQPPFPGFATNTIVCRGDLVVENATIVNNSAPGGASYAIDCYAGANLTINEGAVIDGNGKVAVRMFSSSASPAIDVTVNGGTITGSRAFWIHVAGSNAAVAPDINLTVNGGELISTDATYNMAIYSYSYGNDVSGVDVEFNGGIMNGNVAFGGGSKVGTENVTVNGGTFNGYLGRYTDTAEGWVDIAKP